MNRTEIGALIAQRLAPVVAEAHEQWLRAAPIHFFVVDDLLPVELASEIRRAFPDASKMMLRKSLRELKYVTAQMNQHAPLLEEIIFAFQEPAVVELVQQISGLRSLYPDEHLYAGGISMMGNGHFLNPHLDNSHDKDRARYRVLNLLYYVSPDWQAGNGGNLEVWPNGTKAEPTTIVSEFNRLVVMVTNQHSWHSVSKNLTDQQRCCVSNYYFSDHPVGDDEYFHPTSFRGRPDEPVKDVVLQADAAARGMVRRLFPKGVKQATHVYKKD
ncbi:2OG-Fe(II) oxygenase [Paraburkholderia megapolitana]|uniref:Proline 4-hydroxylase (Includes Rps23 Pro-64 3,4-dihydroxylase Tpa1), contains SM-20 domain n=1 Tax=Paraburkholderia megapolitana TaxID=420953 RepID=A0A1I3GZG1_9BURK|nr:2OG-Fe(II) oxygenase [Paraburkholderia megapolitana]QDQ83128.1 2OG-Fe(II) oxygenase [Paraburkholderia megapolitana]SFI28884.1 Proline 4-hydroxylase (includes Rps23 Pro-64 3,4-dihydroxylase Tpa1), contains SM-20 domain [Paraburkholderia megapolitana]